MFDGRRLNTIRTLACVLALGLLAVAPQHALAAPDAREIQAREDFVAGRYQAALELFARLYAETLHPNYLRNIGRCYQNLGEPDGAITNFRDYLRKAKEISPDERVEIDGYIKEMQDLKKQREAAGVVAPLTGAARTATVTPLPSVAPPPEGTSATTTTTTVVTAAPPAESPPVYERWWFWAIVAGVVAAGVGGAAAAGVFNHTTDASCPKGVSCAP